MCLTGLFLCTFLVVHLSGNFQLFNNDGGKAFNDYANFMTTFPPIKIVSYLLYASIIIHAIWALILTIHNKKARPVGYGENRRNQNSAWNSRNMGILGTILLIFIAVHMQNFWWRYHNGAVPYIEYKTDLRTGETTSREIFSDEYREYVKYVDNDTEVIRTKNLYRQVDFTFQQWWSVAFYVIAMGALAFHLIHGFQSAFQTLGWNHSRYFPLIKFLGVWVFGVLIPIGFAAMPLYFFFK